MQRDIYIWCLMWSIICLVHENRIVLKIYWWCRCCAGIQRWWMMMLVLWIVLATSPTINTLVSIVEGIVSLLLVLYRSIDVKYCVLISTVFDYCWFNINLRHLSLFFFFLKRIADKVIMYYCIVEREVNFKINGIYVPLLFYFVDLWLLIAKDV